MQFNWVALLAAFMANAPQLITSIEAIHAGKSGAEKKNAALAVAGLSTEAVAAADPKDAQLVQASAVLAGAIIDKAVKDKNDSGEFKHAATATVAATS